MLKIITNIIIIFALIALTIVSYNKDVKFKLMINSSVYTEKLVLEERNNGLKGACLKYIIQNPQQANELIAKGPAGNYYSDDNGENWELLQIGSYKYAGELSGRAPNIFWDNEGRMISTMENSLYWSKDGKTWDSKPMEFPAEIIGLGDDNNIWLKGNRDDKEKTVFYAWISWKNENTPEITIRDYDDLKVQPVLISNLTFLASNWMIDSGLPYSKETPKGEWKEKCKGIDRPVIHYFMQDKDNPEHILAAASTNASFSGGFKKNREISYWISENFGENWEPTDSTIFSKWNLADTLLPDTKHCNMHIENNNAFIGNNKIKSNYYFIKAIEDVGWINQKQYYFVGREGIQLGKGTKKCAYEEQIIWSWGEQNPSDNFFYHLGALNNYSRLYEIETPDSISEPEFKTKQYKKIAIMVENDTLELILPCNYGGMWYAKLPLKRPFTFRRVLHIFVHNRLIIFFNLMYIIYVVTFLGKEGKK